MAANLVVSVLEELAIAAEYGSEPYKRSWNDSDQDCIAPDCASAVLSAFASGLRKRITELKQAREIEDARWQESQRLPPTAL